MKCDPLVEIRGSFEPIVKAELVIAFKGTESFIVKNRYGDNQEYPYDEQPDRLIAYYEHTELSMRVKR